jgi:hypothetical protein
VLLLGVLSCSEFIVDPKYATAAWALPSGEQSNNVLFFPMPGGLAGAFFPLMGIPEVPKGAGGHPVGGPNSLPQEVALARLQAMSPEQREMVMAQIKRQRELQLQQQQQALANNNNNNNNGGGGPSGNGGGGVHGMFGINMMAQQRQQQAQHGDVGFGGGVPNYGGGGMNMMNGMGMGQQGGMMNAGMRVPSNINPEMMQSFMQRNSDGSSGMTGP